MNLRTKIIIILILNLVSFTIGYKLAYKPTTKEVQIVEVEKTQIQERVRTIIKEQPDGSKTTIIDSVTETQNEFRSDLQYQSRYSTKKWSVWGSVGSRLSDRLEPVYRLGVDKHALLGFYTGLYGSSDGEIGLTLRYTF